MIRQFIKKTFLNNSLYHFFYWRYRHLVKPDWSSSYLQTVDHPHRQFLREHLQRLEPFSKVLELGCASGPNLELLSKEYPSVHFTGLDISPEAIKNATKTFQEKGISNVSFGVSNLGDLSRYEDNSFDVVFSDAVLIYFDEPTFIKTLQELKRITKKAFIFIEYDGDKNSLTKQELNDMGSYHMRDYSSYFPNAKITKYDIDESIWSTNWVQFGKLITVEL